MAFDGLFTCSTCGLRTATTYEDGFCYLCLKKKQQKEYAEKQKMKMQSGEIRKLPKSSSPMFTAQWAYQGSAKAPYIVSRKGGYKGTGYATEAQKTQEWQCSCKSWTTTVPRAACKHIVAIMLKEGLLKDVTPIDGKPKPVTKTYPLIMVKPEKGHVVISEEEHEAYKKFLAARGTRKAGNQFDEEGRKFRV